jgi:hypothetical protein
MCVILQSTLLLLLQSTKRHNKNDWLMIVKGRVLLVGNNDNEQQQQQQNDDGDGNVGYQIYSMADLCVYADNGREIIVKKTDTEIQNEARVRLRNELTKGMCVVFIAFIIIVFVIYL